MRPNPFFCLCIVFLMPWLSAFGQTGIEQFNYSIGDTFLYREYDYMNPSSGIDIYWGTDTKYVINNKEVCHECYSYAISGVRRNYSGDYQHQTYSAKSYHFQDTISFCPRDTAYWKNLNAKQLKSSVISGVQTGTMPTDASILGTYETEPLKPQDIVLSNYVIYESDTTGVQIATASFVGLENGYLDAVTFAPLCDSAEDDNDLFKIINGGLGGGIFSNAHFDFNAKQYYKIRIKATTYTGESLIKTFTLELQKGVRTQPTGIALSDTIIAESMPVGTFIAKLSLLPESIGNKPADYYLRYATGPYSSQKTYYKNSSSFFIRHDSLFSNRSFDYEKSTKEPLTIITITHLGADPLVSNSISINLEINIRDSIDCTTEIVTIGNRIGSQLAGVSYIWHKASEYISSDATVRPFYFQDLNPYFLTVTYSNGCSATSAPFCEYITPIIRKNTYVGSDKPVLDEDGNEQFYASGPGFGAKVKYEWYENGIQAEDTSMFFSPPYKKDAIYRVRLTNSVCSSAWSEPFNVSLACPDNINLEFSNGELTAPIANSYSWFYNDGLLDGLNDSGKTILTENPGTYWVAAGCSDGVSISNRFTVTPCMLNIEPTAAITRSGRILTASKGAKYEWFLNGILLPNIDQSITIYTPGSYSVKVYASENCWKLSETYCEPYASIMLMDSVLTANGGFTAYDGSKYKWFLNNELLPDTMSFVLPNSAGSYTVEKLFSNGCSAVSDPFVVTSVNENNDSDIKVQYDMNTMLLTISSNASPVSVRIFDATGRRLETILTDPYYEPNVHVDFSTFRKGLYVIHIQSQKAMFIKKIVRK